MSQATPSLFIAILLIKKWEGFKGKAYLCPAGVWTIGYGRTHGVREGDTTTEAREEEWLEDYLIKTQRDMDAVINVPISRNQNASLLSFVYNIGLPRFKSSTLLERLNSGQYYDAANEFQRWKYADGKVLQGLINRRADEANLFCSP